jgi:3(or 17)beta-hydroxysteroid dehydrogenase
VNNAGVILFKNIEDTSLDEWRWLTGINLDGVFLGTKYAIGTTKKSGGGSVINMSSVAGMIGTLDASAYYASKRGVRIFTKEAALEFSKAGYNYNIRVNSVHLGVIETPMLEDMLKDEEKKKVALSWLPIGRFGEPRDVAYGVLYLASDESRNVTGAELVIDGGWTAHWREIR